MNPEEEDKMLEIELGGEDNPEEEAAEPADHEDLFPAMDEMPEKGGHGEDGPASQLSDEELMGEAAKRGLLQKMEMEEEEPEEQKQMDVKKIESRYMPRK